MAANNHSRQNREQSKGKGKKPKQPQMWVQVFKLPAPLTGVDQARVAKAIGSLGLKLGQEHGQVSQKIKDWLNQLTTFQRHCFYETAAQLNPEELVKALKKLATAKDLPTMIAEAQKIGLLPLPSQDLPPAAKFKLPNCLRQLMERESKATTKEQLQLLTNWLETLSPAALNKITYHFAPLSSQDSVGTIMLLARLTTDQERCQFFNLTPKEMEHA